MNSEPKKIDVRSILSVSSVIIGGLPELPGCNGSILTISDDDAERVSRELDEARDVFVELIESAKEMQRLATGPIGGVTRMEKQSILTRMHAAIANAGGYA
jgi:hypothetical protein